MTPEEAKALKKELHYRFGQKTRFHFSEIVEGINEVIANYTQGLPGDSEIAKQTEPPTMKEIMAKNEKEFERLKKEAGIDKPKVDTPHDLLDSVMVEEPAPPPKKKRGRPTKAATSS